MRSAGVNCEPVYFRAGRSPNIRHEKSEAPNANHTTEASIEISSSLGRLTCFMRRNRLSPFPQTPARVNRRRRLAAGFPSATRAVPAHGSRPGPPGCVRSCRRDSAFTSNRFATLAQAIRRTSPTAPMTGQRTLPILPTTSSFNGPSAGAKRASSNNFLPNAAFGPGQLRSQMGIMRATSEFACARVTPGLSRAIPRKPRSPR